MPIKEFALLRERRPWDLELATCHCFHMQTLGASISLSITALAFYSLHRSCYLFISLFFDVRLKPGIFKTSKKSMSGGSDEVWLLSILQKPPHCSLITPAPSSHVPVWLVGRADVEVMHTLIGRLLC